jgi:hypothetical protein
MKKVLITLALAWNLTLVLGVIFNQEYALTRAAGGQFETFPTGIRIAYILNTLIVVWQYRTLLKIWAQAAFLQHGYQGYFSLSLFLVPS